MPKKKLKLKPHFGKLSIILIVVAALLIAADLLTKHFEELYGWQQVIISGFIEIKGGVRNEAAAFGGFNVGQPVLITFTFILIAALLVTFIFIPERRVLLKLSIAIIFAGAVGNLVDRLAFNEVRDWFGLWIFVGILYCNLADFWIVIGVAMVVITLLFLDEWALIPLTKKAKAAQAARKASDDKKDKEVADSKKAQNAKTQSGAEVDVGGGAGANGAYAPPEENAADKTADGGEGLQ